MSKTIPFLFDRNSYLREASSNNSLFPTDKCILIEFLSDIYIAPRLVNAQSTLHLILMCMLHYL